MVGKSPLSLHDSPPTLQHAAAVSPPAGGADAALRRVNFPAKSPPRSPAFSVRRAGVRGFVTGVGARGGGTQWVSVPTTKYRVWGLRGTVVDN